jgi:hydrophobic/amphiphilic exporter-1 (mainly G- bacteria), HAE1 family
MNLSKLSVKRPVTTIMCMLVVIILGIVSLSGLSVDLLPNIEVPVAIISTSYSNVGPEEVEKFVTKPIEQAVSTVEGIDSVRSISNEGNSLIIVMFDWGTDMEFASLHMREKVDLIKGYLPDGANDPIVMKIDPNAQATMQLSISLDMDLADMQSFVEDNIQSKLERINGVASVNINGGVEKEIEISLNAQKLQGYGLSVDYISNILKAENLNLPSGNVKKGTQELLVRTMGEFKSIEEIKHIPIPLKQGGVVSLNDISEIVLKEKDTTQMSIINGERGLSISIQKQSDANTVNVSKNIRKELDKIQKQYPEAKIEILIDSAEYINASIDNVSNTALIGGILAVIVLFIFLRNIRSTCIIAVAIPISIIGTFAMLYFNNITINLMTLGGLALGIGMLVDSSIVVLENIFRFIQEGYSVKEAAVKGASEVTMSVVASTLTTIAVFLPIAFTNGMTGIIFKDLALTVVFSILASLIVSLSIVPMLSSKLLKEDEIAIDSAKKKKNGIFTKIGDAFERGFKGIESKYKKILAWALDHRKSTVLIGIGIFIVSMISIASVGAEFFPETDQGEFSINIELPKGSKINDTKEIVDKVQIIAEKQQEVEMMFVNVGSGGNMSTNQSENLANITVKLKDIKEREKSTSDIVDTLRKEIKDIAGAEISFPATGGFSSGAPVSIEIKGDNLDTLKEISNKYVNVIASIEGTREVESNLGEGKQEVRIKVNRNKASQYGLNAAQISSQVQMAISGKTATQYRVDGEEIDIIVKGDEIYKQSISNLENVNIDTPTGISVPLALVADLKLERSPTEINRVDQSRTVTITSQIYGRDLKNVLKDVEKEIETIDLPAGYRYEMGGEGQDMAESFSSLGLALMLSIGLVYMILASQFESLLNPFVIMFSVPLSFAGGALGLFITRRSLSVPAIIGVIVLTGIVVNNAIVLIDYITIRRKKGETRKEAILIAGPTRLRPIFMTTATTVLGLLPMAIGIGEGAEMNAPMATVVIGGLLFSTILTLVFIPVVYTIFDDIKNRKHNKKNSKTKEDERVLIRQ